LAEHELAGTKAHYDTAAIGRLVAGRPRFPKDLGKELRPVFKRLCALLADRRQLTPGDVELIRLYCFQHDRHSRNAALLRQEGELCTYFRLDSNGQSVPQVKTNLRLKVVTDAERQMAAILSQLGLTPVAGSKVKQTKPNAETEVIPGSVADLYPELLCKPKRPTLIRMLSAEELATADAEESKDANGD
jgi:P27 family predicted phage terminase small subunit